jgi:tetratricopeptide (TPR) repeat protein
MAIECHIDAADIYRSLGMSGDWGRAQFNLGNSYCDLSEMGGEDHWQEAVSRYEASLCVRTREKDPGRHAAVLENLGSAYRRIVDSTGGNVRKSIKCYQRALRIYTAATHPDKSAALENNLGNAYLSLLEKDEKTRVRNARRALRHFDRALRIQSRDRCSPVYGITQYNRAQAHYRLAQASPGGNPKVAVTCLEEALAAFQSCGEEHYTALVRAQLERMCRQQRSGPG